MIEKLVSECDGSDYLRDQWNDIKNPLFAYLGSSCGFDSRRSWYAGIEEKSIRAAEF